MSNASLAQSVGDGMAKAHRQQKSSAEFAKWSKRDTKCSRGSKASLHIYFSLGTWDELSS